MSNFATVTSTGIDLLVEDSESEILNLAASILGSDFKRFAIDTTREGEVQIHCEGKVSFDFNERMEALALAISPLLRSPCEITITTQDEGGFAPLSLYLYAGATESAIAKFEEQCILKRAIDFLNLPTQSVFVQDNSVSKARAAISEILAKLEAAPGDALNATIKTTITVFMLADNSQGVPEMLRHDVLMAGLDCDDGEHLSAATAAANLAGYSRVRAFDERDSAARAIDPSKCYTLDEEVDEPTSTPTNPSSHA